MPVKIRLARRGRKKRPYYHVVVADARAPRDGKYIENIGSYNPMTVPATIELDREKALEWIMKGAQPTDTARAILKFKGVYYRKHLLRGVEKGALTEEKAEEMYKSYIEEKEAKIAARREDVLKQKEDFWKMVSGEIKPVSKAADKEAGEAFREEGDADPNAEEATETDAPSETPAAENEETSADTEEKTPEA
jgi:small subunit ribosomal protein S16